MVILDAMLCVLFALPWRVRRLFAPIHHPTGIEEQRQAAVVLLLMSMVICFAGWLTAHFYLGLGLSRITYAYLMMGIGISGVAAYGWVASPARRPKRRKPLGPGDPDFDYAQALAQSANLPSLPVSVVKGLAPSGPIRYFDRAIVLGAKEREDLTDQERRIVIAERLGVLIYVRPVRNLYTRLMISQLVLLSLFAITLSQTTGRMIVPGLLFFAAGCVRLTMRDPIKNAIDRNQKLADRFTLDIIGDRAQIERSIARTLPVALWSSITEGTPEWESALEFHVGARIKALREASQTLSANEIRAADIP